MKIDIDDFKNYFKTINQFYGFEIFEYFKKKEPDIPRTTVNWRIHHLIKKGVLNRVSRGLYSLGNEKIFIPKLTPESKIIGMQMESNFRYTKFCIWELETVNNLTQHLINYNIIFLDVEKASMKAVYHFFKESRSNVILVSDIYDDISEFRNYLVIRPLITDSPLKNIDNISVPSLEKILVDLYLDKEFFPF